MSAVNESPDILRKYLPFELQDAVISSLENPRDLAALAATCKYWAGLIIPRHIEYRILQLSSTARPVKSFDAAKSVWVDTSMPRSIEHRTARLSKPLLDVLFHLASSPAFTRNIREVKSRYFPRTLVESFKPSEHTNSWNGSLWVFYMLQALFNMKSLHNSLWHITGLTSVTLTGPHGWLSCSGTGLSTFLQRNPYCSYLPSNAIHFKSFYFPHLRKLCMRHAGLVEIAEDEDHHILSFLYAHLPLRTCNGRLETNPGLAYSLLRDNTIPQRKWETISPMVVFEQTMPILRKINGSRVKKLAIARFDSLELVDEISTLFPNVTHLDITDYGAQPIHSIEQYVATLSKFRFLEYFQDSHLWNRIQFLPEAERETAVVHLAASCPNMTRIGCWYSEDGSDVCAVLIRDGENVTWRDETCFES
ncbi:hypothetical protein BDQ17DRAFT_1370933 [Cyathus striatus]|nr:hypothetical protein BDQ17DRAFT_1370933 [Cyathus striatus]